MRTPIRCLLILTAAAVVWKPAVLVTAQSQDVRSLLAEARMALGGVATRAAISSFKITGRVSGRNRLETGSFEIICVLPDKFVQIELRAIISPGELVAEPSYGPSVEHRTTRLGFNSGDLIFQPHVNRTDARTQNFPVTPAQLRQAWRLARAGFASLSLALFAESFAGVPLQFSAAAGPGAEASLQVTGPDVAGTLTFNRQTRLPEAFGRMRYDDYRDVGGRRIPFRITNGLDVWTVRAFLVNVKVGDKVFKPTHPAAGY